MWSLAYRLDLGSLGIYRKNLLVELSKWTLIPWGNYWIFSLPLIVERIDGSPSTSGLRFKIKVKV
jgi:hypothetical protein